MDHKIWSAEKLNSECIFNPNVNLRTDYKGTISDLKSYYTV